jgi:hypothetical protein
MKRRDKHGVESLTLFMVINCYCVHFLSILLLHGKWQQYFGWDTHDIKLMKMCMYTIVQIYIHMAVKEIFTIKEFSES